MADVCGPWTLEQLDQFGTLDSLPFSLDSDIWLTACIRDGDGAVSAAGTVTATPNRELVGAGAIVAAGTVTATGSREVQASGAINGAATVTAACVRVRQLDELQEIVGYGDVYALPGIEFNVETAFSATCDVTASPSRILGFSGQISGLATVSAKGYKYGEEWGDVPDESNTWTPIPDQSNVWTETASGNNSWQSLG